MGVYRRADSPYFWFCLERPNQPRLRESSGIRVDAPTVEQRKDNRQLAEQRYHARLVNLTRGRMGLLEKPTITFDTFATWYDTHEISTHKGAERERITLTRLRRAFGALDLRAIDKDLVKEWRTARLAKGHVVEHFGGKKGPRHQFPKPSARTVNREVDFLQQIMSAAVPKYLDASPLAGLPDLPTVKPVKRFMTEEEEAKILPHLAPDDRAIVLVGLDALVRMVDILNLKRRDDHGAYLEIPDPKRNGRYRVVISPRLREALDAVPKDARSDYYFPRRRLAESASSRRRAIAQMLKRACQKGGVDYGRAADGLTFHWSTRRTGATRLLRAGGEKIVGAVAAMGGWKDPYMLLKEYEEVTLAEQHAAVAALVQSRVSHAKKKRRRKSKKKA